MTHAAVRLLLIRFSIVAGVALVLIAGGTLLRPAPPSGQGRSLEAVSASMRAEPPPADSLADRLGSGSSRDADDLAPSKLSGAMTLASHAERSRLAKLMIQAPPGTEFAFQNVDPVVLNAIFERGSSALRRDRVEETSTKDIRLISIAAALGYEPARTLITTDYPTSTALQTIVQPVEGIRYSLDPLLISGGQSNGRRPFLVLLASYFSGRQALQAYAGDLIRAVRDDPRLQSHDSIASLLDLLTRDGAPVRRLLR